MTTVTLAEAQARLPDLIAGLKPDEEVTILRDSTPVARIVGPTGENKPRPVFGRGKGMITIVSEDDDHLADFAEYM
jgi:antitoxin (DNA-binding transcriptional repressor) of toxin-antitoxin stability system